MLFYFKILLASCDPLKFLINVRTDFSISEEPVIEILIERVLDLVLVVWPLVLHTSAFSMIPSLPKCQHREFSMNLNFYFLSAIPIVFSVPL